MNKRSVMISGIVFVFIIFMSSESYAILDAIAGAASSARDAAYEKFMMLKAVEQLKALRDNYEASMRYYEMYQKMNEGRGILYNVAHRVGDIGDDEWKKAQDQFNYDWITSKAYGSDVDQAIQKMDQYASDKIRYAGKVFEKSLDAQNEGEKISVEADSLNPKATNRMILKTQALQMQLAAQTNSNMAQLLDVNTRLYQLQLEVKEEQLKDWSIFGKSIDIIKKGFQEK